MSSDYRDKLRSLSFRPTTPPPKVTTDVHDHGTADVIEHFDDRVDVTIKPDAYRLGSNSEG